MIYNANNIRDVAILGHLGSGKTTLVEAFAYATGLIKQKGEVEKKNTLSDYADEEKSRGSSINASVVPVYYNDHKLNLIDLPGNDDFVGEILSVTRLIKGAILVIDASSGVQVGTIKHWNTLRRRNIPTIIYVNKMDKENINFEDVLTEIRTKLGKNAVPFTYPIGHVADFDGFVNVVDLKARKYNGVECVDDEIYPDKRAKVYELHNTICEAVASTNEELLEKFFSGEELTRDEIHKGLREGVLNGELIPVIVGSATKNIGIHTLLSMMVDYLPSPSDLKPYIVETKDGKTEERKTTDDEPFSAYVFKTIVDPYAGIINIFKVNSGVLKLGDEIYVPQTGKTEKITTLFTMCGKNQTNITEVHAGDIAATTKLNNVVSSYTLCSPKNIVTYKPVKYPTAVIFLALVPKNKADEDKLSQVLQKIMIEDQTVEVKRNQETKQLLLGGAGLSHLSYILEKMKNVYKVEVQTEEPKIVYRESITKEATGDGRYIKQSGGAGYYGVVTMCFEPADHTYFTEEVFGGAVPKNYFPAVEKGFLEAMQQGLLAGFPVINVKATLLDGKYHSVDSNEMAFKMAAILAFKEAYMKANPIILEPIYKIVVNVHNQYLGDVLSDLNQKRAKVLEMNDKGNGEQEVIATVPEAEILNYAQELKAITQSSAYFNREFLDYEEVPAYLKDKVIEQNKLN